MIAELDTSRNYKKFYVPGEGEIDKATSERKWYSFDRQGSVVHTVSEQGYILEWLYYDAYGNRIFQTGSPGPFRYNGKSGYFYDKDVDMDLLQARYYIPMIGRFMQADPIGQSGGLNTYAYCGNNPFIAVDPDGLRPITSTDISRMQSLYRFDEGDQLLRGRINLAVVQLKKDILAVPEGQQDPIRLRALWWAIDELGNTAWGAADGVNRCNAFVYGAYELGAKVNMPDRPWKGFINMPNTQLFGANEFGNPAQRFSELVQTTSQQAGDIMAFRTSDPNLSFSGHMGLKLGPGLLIYAGGSAAKLGTFEKNLAAGKRYPIAWKHK